ncbi:MAG: hypothetical protein AAFO81_03205 [Pseudomonadota bacterium]
MTHGVFRTAQARTLAASGIAFVFYALWAAWANRLHEPSAIAMAAATQGLYSALVTAGMTSLVERLFRGAWQLRWRVLRCTTATLTLLIVSSLGVHWLAGTAEVLVTVLPSWLFGSLYALVYALGLARAERSAEHTRR